MKKKHQPSQRKIKSTQLRETFASEIDAINAKLNEISLNQFSSLGVSDQFETLPILNSTKLALSKNSFVTMSPIQQQTLLYSLCGRDLIGVSHTGSGKTLAFLIPLIETLMKFKFSSSSGIGAIIIAPTRILASQTFNVLKKLITDTPLTAGLVTGKMKGAFLLSSFNIVVATPWKLRTHTEEDYNYDSDKLKFLVLDEADMLIKKEFFKDVKVILDSLPSDRQTLLFSATCGPELKQLTKISLKQPVRVILTDQLSAAIPDSLSEYYAIVPFKDKINTVFSFIRSHRSEKIIVFTETVKMVIFLFQAFRHLRPGIPMTHFTRNQTAEVRFSICHDFSQQKRGVIFSTDVAARGMDFPQVNWVIQMDCPSSADTYIHRVGRTARFFSKGKSILFLAPSELKMLDLLKSAKTNPKKFMIKDVADIRPQLVDVLSRFLDVKQIAQIAFRNYLESVRRKTGNGVFNIEAVLVEKDDFAKSFGLISSPIIKKGGEEEEEEGEEEPLFTIVDDDQEYIEETAPAITPTIEFLDPDDPIPEEEVIHWKQYLKNLLPRDEQQQKQTTKIIENTNIEEEAAKLLFGH